jgi:hypothetical protein
LRGSGIGLLDSSHRRPTPWAPFSTELRTPCCCAKAPAGQDYYIGKKLVTRGSLNDGGWGHHENDYGFDGAIKGSATASRELRHQLPQ